MADYVIEKLCLVRVSHDTMETREEWQAIRLGLHTYPRYYATREAAELDARDLDLAEGEYRIATR
jgi:hypothetical protein